jgi:hypothetical protein
MQSARGVPPPKRHSVRYFGVFAAGAGIRAKVIRKPGERRRRACVAAPIQRDADLDEKELGRALRDELGFNPLALGPPPMPQRTRRLDWASLLQRVYQADVLHCACGGRRKVTAFIPGGNLARQILEKLGLEATGPPIAKARARLHQEHFDLHPDDPAADPQYPD